MKGWADIGSDMNWEDYGGKWAKKSRDGTWFVVRFINMYDACGERDCKRDGQPQYVAETVSVNLADIDEKTLKSARECVGLDIDDIPEEHREVAQVEACVSYGAFAPLDSFSGDHYPLRIRAQARRAAEELMRDSEALEERLERPVNKIGSTAREYMQGDLNAALIRYQSGDGTTDPAQDLMLKLHGMPPREGSST